MKITTTTRDRLRSLGDADDSLEDVVVAALDAYESQQFWAQAEAAASPETAEQRTERKQVEAAVDAWMAPCVDPFARRDLARRSGRGDAAPGGRHLRHPVPPTPERAVVAPVLDAVPASPRPWHIPLSGDRPVAVAVNQLGTMPVDWLLERVDSAGDETLR